MFKFHHILFLTFFFPVFSWAQDSQDWILAQQFFVRKDYEKSYKHALEEIKNNKSNLEARRLASKSAKELKKYTECLQFMALVPTMSVNSEDVGLIGECGSYLPMSQKVLQFLHQQLVVSENRDMALYWLGLYLYRKKDYPRALRYFEGITILPQRLEKQRVFMIQRLKEVLKDMPTEEIKKEEVPEIKKEAEVPLEPEKKYDAMVFVYEWTGKIYGEGNYLNARVPLGIEDQKEFEKTKNKNDILVSKGFEPLFYGDTFLNLALDLKTDTSSAGWGFWSRTAFSSSFSYSSLAENTLYFVPQVQNTYGYLIPQTGYHLGGELLLALHWQNTFFLEGLFFYAFTGDFHFESQSYLQGAFRLRWQREHSFLISSFSRSIYYTPQREDLLHGISFSLYGDLDFEKFGFHSTFEEPFFQYSSMKIGKVNSKYMLLASSMLGDFLKFNFSPYLKMSSSLKFYTQIGYTQESKRQYWSYTDAQKKFKYESWDKPTKEKAGYQKPTALYQKRFYQIGMGFFKDTESLGTWDLGCFYHKGVRELTEGQEEVIELLGRDKPILYTMRLGWQFAWK